MNHASVNGAAHANSEDTALVGVTVLELGHRIGASVCGSLLSQLGATVICVEHVDAAHGTKWHNRTQLAAGKLSIVPAGGAADRIVADAVACCDVIITSSDLDSLQLARGGLPSARPDAIVCDVTAFGTSGPLAGRGWSDLQIQAVSGVLDSTGHQDGPPMPIAIPIVEQVAGIYAAAAILAALRVRRRDGPGQPIEMALYDVGFSLMTSFLPVLLGGEAHEGATRVGNRQTMVAPWNVYRAADGWLLLCAGNDEQWRRICDVIGRPELGVAAEFATVPGRLARVGEVDAIIGAWVGPRTVADCVARFGAAVIPCGPIVRIEGHPREDNLLHRGMIHVAADPATGAPTFVPGSPIRMSRSPGRAPQRIPAAGADRDAIQALARQRRPQTAVAEAGVVARNALTGLRVIEIGHYTTAPLAARHLANLGAEVIKIEAPEGEAVRRWPPARGGQGIFFTFQNADKKSVVLDLETEHGRAALGKLIATADVLIENLKPGALAKRGFPAEAMQEINPRIVSCAVSGFGADSLYAGRPAFDAVIQAMSGLMDVVEAGEMPLKEMPLKEMPLKTGPSSADVMGAAMALTAILAALEYRDRTGMGQHLDLSMQDVGAWATQGRWNGRRDQAQAGVTLRCSDGYVVAAADAVALTGLAAEALTQTRSQAAERLEALGVVAAPVLAVEEVVRAEQTRARRLWFPIERDGISYPLLASPLRLQRTPARVLQPGPALGRDTEAVLAEVPGPRRAVQAAEPEAVAERTG